MHHSSTRSSKLPGTLLHLRWQVPKPLLELGTSRLSKACQAGALLQVTQGWQDSSASGCAQRERWRHPQSISGETQRVSGPWRWMMAEQEPWQLLLLAKAVIKHLKPCVDLPRNSVFRGGVRTREPDCSGERLTGQAQFPNLDSQEPRRFSLKLQNSRSSWISTSYLPGYKLPRRDGESREESTACPNVESVPLCIKRIKDSLS